MGSLVNTSARCFPPLSGYLIPKFSKPYSTWIIAYCVSVPSRGILFPNNGIVCLYDCKRWVSVPSRGILFPNQGLLTAMYWSELFPSPLGVSYFQIYNEKCGAAKVLQEFPSPLGVSYFQIKGSLAWCEIQEVSFRPPLGVSYFQIVF